MRCIEEYAEAYNKDGRYGDYNVRRLLDEFTLYFVPMSNPDGTDISNAGELPLVNVDGFDPDEYKLNANGVNLNRNFPFNWDEHYSDWTLDPGDSRYPGKYGASENETKAIIQLCADNDFLWLLDMHIVGNGMYWRDGLNGVVDGDMEFAFSIAYNCGYQMFNVSMDAGSYSGGLENWFRYAYNRPSICIEMIPYSQSGYYPTYRGFNSYFEAAVNWNQSRYTYLQAMAFSLKSNE